MAKYDDYAMTICSEIPYSDMDILIRTFIHEAEVAMGSELDELAVPRVIEFVTKDYKHLPLYTIAGAFKRGSLGQYGAGRLTPRTIFGWMNEMSGTMMQQAKGIADNLDMGMKWDGLHKYPVGRAIGKKIDWIVSGRITEAEYDKIPLKEMYDRMSRGLDVVPELWGIESRKNES